MREFINEDKDKYFQLKAEVKDQDGYTVSSSHVFSIMEREERKKITSESAGLKQMLLLFPKLFLLCRTLNRKHIHITSSVFRSLYS